MSTLRWSVVTAILVLTNVVSVFLFVSKSPEVAIDQPRRDDPADSARLRNLEASVTEVLRVLGREPLAEGETVSSDAEDGPLSAPVVAEAIDGAALEQILSRLDSIESTMREMKQATESSPAAVVEANRQIDFTTAEGFAHADTLFESGKFASAAEGYLEFIEANEDHPDLRVFAKKARSALLRAGYLDRAIALQQELVEGFPEHRAEDLSRLARMQVDAKNLDGAIKNQSDAIALTKDAQERLWRMMYRAWYIEMRDGNAAAIEAYREVDAARESLGVDNQNMVSRIAEKIAQAQKRLDAQGS